MLKYLAVSGLLLIALATSSPAISSTYTITPDSIYRHISVLADDSTEGREVGEVGEMKAARYITEIFHQAGLEPAGDTDPYLQAFDFVKRIETTENNRLVINGVELQLDDYYVPLQQSASTEFEFDEVVFANYGIKIPDDEGDYNDYDGLDVAGKAVVVKRYSPPAKSHPDLDLESHSYLANKITTALEHDAAAVVFITPPDKDDSLKQGMASYVHARDIPIIFLKRKGLDRLGLDLSAPVIDSIYGRTELIRTRDTGYNVVGYLPGASDTTVVLGAHYDHLGWGGFASLYKGAEKMIHNGADDNGSGVAALLELARFYAAATEQLKYSILFVAFSGEEIGVLGSSHFVKAMDDHLGKIRMMVNMDMIGRLGDHDRGLAVMGTGTSEEFAAYFDSLEYDDISLVLKQSGTGPSDHSPFYNAGIPSLTFFTGPHADYHKPTDDIEFINPEGIVRVTGVVNDLVSHFDTLSGPLTFVRTKDSGEGKRRSRFAVTLGIMPDHVSEVKGVSVAAVVPDRPGEKAGLAQGDVIIKMGTTDIADIYDYMSALGKYKAGDTTTIIVTRATDTLTLDVAF